MLIGVTPPETGSEFEKFFLAHKEQFKEQLHNLSKSSLERLIRVLVLAGTGHEKILLISKEEVDTLDLASKLIDAKMQMIMPELAAQTPQTESKEENK